MKQRYLIPLLVVLVCNPLFAQNSDTKKADEHFAELEFVEAVEEYTELVEDGKATPYVYKRLAEAHFNLSNTKAAEGYYAKVVTQENATPEDYYRYAQLLKANEKYDLSNQWMQKFAEMAPMDERAKAFVANPDYLSKIMGMEPAFEAEALKVNTGLSDFGAHLFQGKLYFVSSRDRSGKTYGWNQQPTLDVYVSAPVDSSYQEASALPGEVNSKYNEGTVSITQDGKTMYFTRNNYYQGDYQASEEGVGELKIYSAQWIAGEWTNVQPLPFTSSEYSTGHTALSPDGKTLYFSSDMPGGSGDSDLYKVAIQEDGSFGEPQNLGEEINSVGRESFPFIGKDGTLYFSSNGHLGMGGLDIFYAKPEGEGFSQAKNMGSPVNSSADDFAFTYYKDQKQAFVSSNRGSAEDANDDIYRLRPVECVNDIQVLVVDADTGEPIQGASAKMYTPTGKFMATKEATDGEVVFTQPCGMYEVQADADGYFSNSVAVKITREDSEATITLQLPPEPEITETEVVLEPIYFEFDKAEITPEAALELDRLVRVMQEHPGMKIQVRAHTDSRGSASYNLSLSDRRAKSTAAYIVSQGIDASRISGKGFGESMPEVACGSNCTEEQYAQNRRSEFLIIQQ